MQGLGQYVRTGINIEMAANLQQAGIISPAAQCNMGRMVSVKRWQAAMITTMNTRKRLSSVTSDFFQKAEPLISSLNAFF
jgi:hypothetical protein